MNKLLFIALGCMCFAQMIASMPAPDCETVFSQELCESFNALESEHRERRQLPPPPPGGNGGDLDKALLERLLKEKINFLTRFGLLKRIPFLGQVIHDIVERDPEGVSKALSNGIFGVIDLVKIFLALQG